MSVGRGTEARFESRTSFATRAAVWISASRIFDCRGYKRPCLSSSDGTWSASACPASMNISSVTRFACVAKIAIPSRIATKRFTAKISGRCFALPITHSGYSTVDDLLRFAQALRSGKLISRPLLREATTAQTHYGYSLGFVLFGEGGFGHTGGMPGANGELLILPRSRYLLIVLVNRDPRMAS